MIRFIKEHIRNRREAELAALMVEAKYLRSVNTEYRLIYYIDQEQKVLKNIAYLETLLRNGK